MILRCLRAALPALALAAALPAAADPPAVGGSVMVHLADGSSVPLQGWTFSYEYATWKKGQTLDQAQINRRESLQLWVGKKVFEPAGGTVEIGYVDEERVHDDRGVATQERMAIARTLAVQLPGGARSTLKLEAPTRELLAPDLDKNVLVTARALDLRGQTLTGTSRDFCLLSFSAMVECGAGPENRVTRLEFPPAE